MKITLCGKGGCGKSTISSLLAKEFAKEGKTVLVIDTDESNYGLHRQLGLELPNDFTNFFGGKKAVIEELRATGFTGVSYFEKPWTISEIPSEYISEKDGIKLIAIGKIHETGEGCACPMGMISQQFIGNLDIKPNEIVITDTEAGIEHFGRNIEKDVDAVLMVVDPSYESFKLSEKVSELSGSINKPVYYILNKVDSSNESTMREAVGKTEKIIAAMPSESKLALAGLKGEELRDEYPEIKKLAKFLSDNFN
ncbi:MAG: P-loop NTPase [Clostridiales bacterium]|nr:P-loop NTPase [Clostridiales bacterium]